MLTSFCQTSLLSFRSKNTRRCFNCHHLATMVLAAGLALIAWANFFAPEPAVAQSSSRFKSIKMVLPGHKKRVRVRYIARKGRAIFQGDIDLGPVRRLGKPAPAGRFSSTRKKSGIGSSSQPLSVRSGGKYLWPGGVVPFEFDSNVRGTQAARVALRAQITIAINFWNANTNLNFIARNNEKDRIRLRVDTGIAGTGQSAVGRKGGRQDIKLKVNAGSSVIIHELGHAIGLWHEQSRMDRDSNVEILLDNVRNDAKGNFDKHVHSVLLQKPFVGNLIFSELDRMNSLLRGHI